jgi:hypothetical protein
MLPTETFFQYCSKIRGMPIELGLLNKTTSEPLLRLLIVHGLPPPSSPTLLLKSLAGVINVNHGSNSWDVFERRRWNNTTHLNTHLMTSTATSIDLNPSDLVWLGQPGLDKNQADRMMILFTCPIRHCNNHTLYHCGAVK